MPSDLQKKSLSEWNYWWPSTCSCEVAVYVVRESNEEVDKNEGSKLEECTCYVDIALHWLPILLSLKWGWQISLFYQYKRRKW